MQNRPRTFVSDDIVVEPFPGLSEVETLPRQLSEFKMICLRKAALSISGAWP
jgi:hypothetical protein